MRDLGRPLVRWALLEGDLGPEGAKGAVTDPRG